MVPPDLGSRSRVSGLSRGGPLRRRDARDVEPCEIHRSSWRTSPRDRFSANRGLGRPREANVRPLSASRPRGREVWGGDGCVTPRQASTATPSRFNFSACKYSLLEFSLGEIFPALSTTLHQGKFPTSICSRGPASRFSNSIIGPQFFIAEPT